MRTILTAAALLTPDTTIPEPLVVIEDGIITELTASSHTEIPAGRHFNLAGTTLVPGFLDVHVHGGAGRDVMETDAAALGAVSAFLATRGVAGFLPTTVTAPIDATLASLASLANFIAKPLAGARPLGMHLEGPFLSHAKRGVHPPDLLQSPSIELFDRLWQAAEGHIRLMTIAPELPGALDLIAYATHLGVRVSLGHSNADTQAARAGIAAGAKSATHTFNAMRALDHRDPGIAGVVLDDASLFAELICDGIHVDPAMVRLYWRAKGADRAILVTDGISATGMPDGAYRLGGMTVQVCEGRCTHDGVLAGSVLTMDRAVRNFAAYTGAELGRVAGLASRNPARLVGLEDRCGALAVGRRADIAVLGPEGDLRQTLLGGCPVRP